MDKNDALTYEPPYCQIVIIQSERVLDGSPQASTRDIDYEDLIDYENL